MKHTPPFVLRQFPLPFRLGIAALVLTLLGGYLVAGLHMRWHYDNRDESPGLTINDIIGAYHGVRSPSPLVAALERGHPEEFADAERAALLGWLAGDRLSQDYDNLDLGDLAPSEIMTASCLDCHTRSASGPDAWPQVPLDYWDDVRVLAYSKDIQPAGTDIVAASQHTHAPSMAMVLLVLAALCACTRFPVRLTGWVVLIAGVGLLVDMAGWWITRSYAPFAYAIVIGGGLYAIGTGITGVLVVLDCVLPAGRHK